MDAVAGAVEGGRMTLNPFYVRGYEAGYDKGVKTALNASRAKLIMERDLIYIYGTLAIVLTEKHHWKQQSVANLIAEIQTRWRTLGSGDATENMAQMVERITGLQLDQTVDDILNGGWE